jgi:hypothetical protein
MKLTDEGQVEVSKAKEHNGNGHANGHGPVERVLEMISGGN